MKTETAKTKKRGRGGHEARGRGGHEARGRGGGTRPESIPDVQEQLARVDVSANGQFFESQVLAGSTCLNESYVCLDSKKTILFLQNRNGAIFSKAQSEALHGLAKLISGVFVTDLKLEKIANNKEFKAVGMEFDGFFTRRTASHCNEAHTAIWNFLGRTSTHRSRLDSTPDPQLATFDRAPLVSSSDQPTHVVFEVCITGEEAGFKLFQLAKDICAAHNIGDHKEPITLPILYLNGNLASANKAATMLHNCLQAHTPSSPMTDLDALVAALRLTYVLFTPYRNVYDVLDNIQEQMAARDKAVDSKLEALGERMVELLEMIRASSRSRGDG